MTSHAFSLLSADGFMPHGMCYLWRADILLLHCAADALIAIAYFSIPFTLVSFARQRHDLAFKWMFVCFAIFIVACGSTHLMEIVVIWHPYYWLSGVIKGVTAIASLLTAFLLARLLPMALAVPSPEVLRRAYAELENEVAERRRTEQQLIAANERLRGERARERLAAIVESSDDAIIGKTTDGVISSWNRGAQKIFGYAPEEVIGKPVTILFPPDRLHEETEILEDVKHGKVVPSFDTVRLGKSGQPIDVSVTISPVHDDNGVLIGASKIARDITRRKRAQEVLEEQSQMLELAQVMVLDLKGRIIRWTTGAQKTFGYAPNEAVGRIWHELLVTRFSVPLTDIEARFEREGYWEGEISNQTKDGRRLDVASVWSLGRDAEGKPLRILHTFADVTERRLAQEKLLAQVARLHLLNVITRSIAERSDVASIIGTVLATLEDRFNIDFGCFCVNESSETLVIEGLGPRSFGLGAQIGLRDRSLIPFEQSGLTACLSGQLVYEPDVSTEPAILPQRLSDGGMRSMAAAPLLIEEKLSGILIVARREPGAFDSGDCEFLSQLSGHAALAAQQMQLHSALQVAYENLRQTQQAVMRQEKLRVLGQMASGIAHDINNALSPAALYVGALLDQEFADPEARNHLQVVQNAIMGVAQTVARMKDIYSQRDPELPFAPVVLNSLVEQAIELTRARWNTIAQESGIVIRINTDLAPDLPSIMGNEGELRDALINLIVNAADAMPKGGVLTVRSGRLGSDRVEVVFRDTGVGMDAATRSRCLELYFTTKGERGSGLGLPMVYGTIEHHHGELQIESEMGVGTTIRLLFPVAATVLAPTTATTANVAPHGPLRILIVDDDPLILRTLQMILERDGHRVEAAAGGQEGIDASLAAAKRDEPFDIVITDLGMPKVDGRAVAAAVKALRPQTAVLLLTGWGHRLLAESAAPEYVDRVLPKPPKLGELRATLAALANHSGI